MAQKAPWLAIATAALAIAATGCNREQQADTERTAERAAGETAQAGREAGNDIQDGWITTKVQAKYFTTPDVKGRNIDVSTSNNVVTLTGTVESEQARQEAIRIARETDGVTRVEDRLALAASQPSDQAAATRPAAPGTMAEGGSAQPKEGDQPVGTAGNELQPNAWITTKIHSKYFTDGTVKARNIDVDTNNGVVTLTGTIESEAERQQAVKLARETEGVRRVEDRLRLDSSAAMTPAGDRTHETEGASASSPAANTERMTDAGITSRVQSKFFLDDSVKARNINVDTHDGVVTLSGEIQSDAEHKQALSIARSVDGVKNVDDQLQVKKGASTDPSVKTQSAIGAIDDEWLTTKIQSKFFLDDLVKGGQVNVSTDQATVTLTGQVPSQEAKQRAETIARNTDGVKRVQNQLEVNSAASSLPPVKDPTR